MRIGIAINRTWNIYNFRQGIIKALIAEGHEVVAIAPTDQYVARVRALGCEYADLPMTDTGSNPIKELITIFRFRKILKDYRIDVLLTYTIKCNLYGTIAAKRVGIPVICNISGLGTAFLSRQLSSKIAILLSRLFLRTSDHLFFQNKDDQREFVKATGLSGTRQSLINGSGIDLEKFKQQDFVFKNEYQFLVLARLIREKGIVEYANAASIVKEKYPDSRFLLVGSLDVTHSQSISKQELDVWIDKGWLDYLPHTDHIVETINRTEVVVLPSYREGTPRSLLEGAACGKPLITSNVPGCKEVVSHEVNGFLCTVKSADSLAEQCIRYLKLDSIEKQKMGQESRRIAEQFFDESIVIKSYLDKIKELT